MPKSIKTGAFCSLCYNQELFECSRLFEVLKKWQIARLIYNFNAPTL